jgi:hypothetical protein
MISSIFEGIGGQETGAQLGFEPVELVFFGGFTCLDLLSPLNSIVSWQQR